MFLKNKYYHDSIKKYLAKDYYSMVEDEHKALEREEDKTAKYKYYEYFPSLVYDSFNYIGKLQFYSYNIHSLNNSVYFLKYL